MPDFEGNASRSNAVGLALTALNFLLAGCGFRSEAIGVVVADAGRHATNEPDSGAESERCTTGSAAGHVLWTKSYFNPEINSFTAMSQMVAVGDGLVVSGTMATSGGSAGWVARLGNENEVVWEDFVLPSTAECRVLGLKNGDLLVGCTITVDCPPGVAYHDCNRDILFRRYAPNGDVRWEELFSGDGEKGNDGTSGGFVELSNGDVVVPYDFSTPNGSSDSSEAHLRAYDPSGQKVWDREIDVPNYSSVNLSSLVGTEDGKVLYARAGLSDAQASIVKLDSSGDVLWAKAIAEGRSLYEVGIVGDGIAAVGSETFESERSAVIEVFDSEGTSQLVKYFSPGDGGRATANAVTGTPGGRLFVAITSEAASDDVAKAYIVELGPDGEELWRSEGFGDSLSTIGSLAIGEDCSLLVAGRRWEQVGGETRDVALGAELSL